MLYMSAKIETIDHLVLFNRLDVYFEMIEKQSFRANIELLKRNNSEIAQTC